MKKLATNLNTAGQYATMGLAGGIGIGGIMELIRQIKAERDDDARKRRSQQTSRDTIVIELPKSPVGQKLAATIKRAFPLDPFGWFDNSATAQNAKALTEQGAINRDGSIPGEAPVVPEKPKETWDGPTFALSVLGGGAGIYGGYKLMAALGARYREQMLKRKLEAAKKHHMEAVLGIQQAKTAELEYIESVFTPQTKVALSMDEVREAVKGWYSPGTQARPGDPAPMSSTALGALYTIMALGTGGMAYGTKKVLDDRARLMDKEEDEAMNKPRVSRILLKSAKYGEVELDCVDTKVALALSVLANKRDIGYLGARGVKVAAARHSLTPEQIINKLNLVDIADTVVELKQASGLWAELRKPFEKKGQASLASFLAGATGNEYIGMLGGDEKDNTDEVADKVIEKLDQREANAILPKEQSQVVIEAQGPEAKQYVESNRERLARVVKAMAHNGTL